MRKRVIAVLLGAVMIMNISLTAQASGVFEAEQATTVKMNVVRPENPGEYTGEGYIVAEGTDSTVEFKVNAEEAGNYAVDVRYSSTGKTQQWISIYVNDTFIKERILPETLNADTYGILTESLPLEKGENRIRYQTGERTDEGAETLKAPSNSTGPLYWMAYESPFEQDHYLEEERWDKNVEWMAAEGFVDAGYHMMSTDGWVEGAQVINENGYVTKYNYSWNKDWKGMADQLKEKGMTLGVYYDPLWVTAAAYNSDAKIIGTDIPVKSLIDDQFGHFSNFKAQDVPLSPDFEGKEWCKKGEPALYWLDTDKEGAEQYIKGYVKHFADAGATFLRVDFLGWYENGINGDNKQNGKPAYGTKRYEKALMWMSEACKEYGILFSLVMPNQYNHAAVELKYGDMMRVNEDVSNGGWDNDNKGPEKGWPNNHISGRRRGQWQAHWAQWGNSFDAFTGWADVGGRGQMILDGDFLRMARFDVVRESDDRERPVEGDELAAADAQKRSAVSLAAMAGSPICIADQYDTMNKNAPEGVDNKVYYLNEEILNLNKSGFVGKPMGLGESERWAGQLPDGSWVVALFNRDRTVKTQTLDFKKDLGIIGNAAVRELWQHRNLGKMNYYTADLSPCDCVVLKITPDTVRYEAEVGSLRDDANSNRNHSNFSGWGFADKLENRKGDVIIAVAAEGTKKLQIRYCNGGEKAATAALYINEKKIQDVSLAPTGNWDTWKTVAVENVEFASGENLVDIQCVSNNGFNLDYIEIGEAGAEPEERVHKMYQAESAEIGSGAKQAMDHQLAYGGKFVDSLDGRHWEGSKDTLKFTVEVEEEGDYDLSFRYANAGADATADIFINGKKLGYFTFPTVYPGAWDTWGVVTLHECQTADSIEGTKPEGIEIEKVHLTEGENTVEYKHGNNALNMDCLLVTKHEGAGTIRVVESAESPEDITVPLGTAFEALNLPEKIKVKIKGEETPVLLPVVWNKSDFTENAVGKVKVMGTLQLEDGMTNAAAEIAVNVTVQAEISSIIPLTEITVEKGTAFEELLLPKEVEVTLKDSQIHNQVKVTWSQGEYDAQTEGRYILSGELELLEGMMNPQNLRAEIVVKVTGVSDENSEIISVEASEDIEAEIGTVFENLPLPGTAEVKLKNQERPVQVAVTWEEGNYNPQQPGNYTLSGELNLPEGMENPQNLKAEIVVKVTEGPDENSEIISVRAFEEVEAAVGTAFENLPLPGTAEVELKSQETPVQVAVTWEKGNYNPQQAGKYTLSGELNLPEGMTNPQNLKAQITVNVKKTGQTVVTPPAVTEEPVRVGAAYTVGQFRFKVTSTGKKTVAVTGSKNKSMKKIRVPSTVKIKGKTYKVTEVGASAYKNCKRAKSVTIGSNVRVIKKNAFYGCTKVTKVVLGSKKLKQIDSKAFYKCKALKSITIKSTVLKKVGSKAFTGTSKKLVVKVPKKKKAAYKKLLKNKGLSKNAKIK